MWNCFKVDNKDNGTISTSFWSLHNLLGTNFTHCFIYCWHLTFKSWNRICRLLLNHVHNYLVPWVNLSSNVYTDKVLNVIDFLLTMFTICSTLTIKRLEQHQWRRFKAIIDNFEYLISIWKIIREMAIK